MVQSFKLALRSTWNNKMRALLTILDIIIGVMSVIILVSLVNAYMSCMTKNFAGLGTNQVTVNMMNMSSRSVPVDEMHEFFEEDTDTFDHVAPQATVSTAAKHGNDTMSPTNVTGVSEDYLSVRDYQLQGGQNIQYPDIISRQEACVIGYYVATELYGNPEEVIDQTIKMDGYTYRMMGMVKRQDEESQKNRGTGDFLWMPYSCAVKMFRNANISNYTFTIQNLEKASKATELISNLLMETFKNEGLFDVTVMSEMLDPLNSMIAMVSAGLGDITGTSLLVTGIDAMNVMLVSVTEQTREIGIQKALEAKRGVILQQFVIETAVQSPLGGILGVILGSIATTATRSLTGLNASPTSSTVIVSFSVSVAIGLFFGYTSVRRAVGLNPIDALRSE